MNEFRILNSEFRIKEATETGVLNNFQNSKFKIQNLGLTALLIFLGALLPFGQASASSIPSVPNNLGLVGCWNFGEGVGSIASDCSGKGKKGTLTGSGGANNLPQWTAGKIGTGLNFDGTDDYVLLSSSAYGYAAMHDSPRTVSLWFKANSTAGTQQLFCNTDFATVGNQGCVSTGMVIVSGTLRAQWLDNGFSYQSTSLGSFTDTSSWHNFVLVFTGSIYTGYLDGALLGSTSSTAHDPRGNSEGVMTVGTRISSSVVTEPFSGSIDDVRLYSRALSATEVATLYAQTGITKRKNASRGLVAYYPMSEGAGTTTADATGQGNNGTLTTSPIWAFGKFGNGITFNGTSNYVTLGSPARLAVTNFTVAGWFNSSNAAKTRNWIVAHRDDANGANGRFDLLTLPVTGNGKLYGQIYDTGYTAVQGSTTLSSNTWYHGALTYDGVTLVLYLNGTQDASTSYTGTFAGSTQLTLIGEQDTGANLANGFQGTLDDIRFYNRALTATEIANLYASSGEALGLINSSQNTQLTNGLVGMWDFNGPRLTTTTATDASGNGNNGTLTGGPVPTRGVIGQALQFDGVDDYVTVSSHPMTNLTAFTVTAWLKVSSTAYDRPLGQINSVFTAHGSSWEPYLYTSGVGHTLYNGTGSDYDNYDATISPALTAGTWHHVAWQWNSAHTMKTYVDGVEVSGTYSTGGTKPTTVNNSYPFTIGRGALDGAAFVYFQGRGIDDVRIYNRVLTASEVLSLYNQAK